MMNSISKWLPNKTPHPARHGQRTPTNTTTTTESQTRIQTTPTQIIQQTTTPTTTSQHPTLTKQLRQLRLPNLPRRGRPIFIKRQSQHHEQPQNHISLKNYEILSQESYAQLLNQSQVVTSQNQVSNQVQNSSQLLNQQPLLLNANQILNQTQNYSANQAQLHCTTTQPNLNRARTEFLTQNRNQLLNCATTQPNVNQARTEFISQSQQRAKISNQLSNCATTQHNLNRARTEFLNQSHQIARRILQANQLRELQIIQQEQTQEQQNQKTILEEQTPIYQIISVPFLARSFQPTPCVKQRESKTNGLVKLKQFIVNANGKNGQRIILCPEQENISTHLNLLNQQPESSNTILNTTTVKSQSTTPTNLDLTKSASTTPSAEMMGIQLSGNGFQDLNGVLQIAAVEELMAPACLDDYFIETNNNIDFDTIKGTYKLQESNEMTINQMNVNYAGQTLQLLPENGQEQEQLLKDIPGEEHIYNILRLPHSEELVTLTQPSIEHETTNLLESESLFTQYIDTNCMFAPNREEELSDNNSSSYIQISPDSPGSPLPTESDCIATSELHTFKYNDEEQPYRLEFSPQSIEQPIEPSTESQHSPVCQSNSSADEEALDLEQILKQLESASQQQQQNSTNLKRSSDHLGATQTKIAKKSRMNIPITRLVTDARCEDILFPKVPDTPEVCNMVDEWLTEDIDVSMHSLSSSPSWSGTSFTPPDFIAESITLIEPKYENPPSIASSYICDEPSYATPSPSNNSSYTLYSTNPNSPAISQYGSNSGSTRKPRGRPPKIHSDLPNPEILRNLPETERKRIEDRCKNNEASRQSRQKNKEKQMILIAEEEREQQRNEELKSRMRSLEKQHRNLKKVLYRKLGNSNSF